LPLHEQRVSLGAQASSIGPESDALASAIAPGWVRRETARDNLLQERRGSSGASPVTPISGVSLQEEVLRRETARAKHEVLQVRRGSKRGTVLRRSFSSSSPLELRLRSSVIECGTSLPDVLFCRANSPLGFERLTGDCDCVPPTPAASNLSSRVSKRLSTACRKLPSTSSTLPNANLSPGASAG